MNGDEYINFYDLCCYESQGEDFDIRLDTRESPAVVLAPHGGKIESGTSEIAAAIADDIFNLYCFEGIKVRANRVLHITSTNFDEPQCLEIIGRCDVVVAVHGLQGNEERVDVGGLDCMLRDLICAKLKGAGFKAHTVANGPHAARSPCNICNRGSSGKGTQLEITRSLRDALKTDKKRMGLFADAVQRAMKRRIAGQCS